MALFTPTFYQSQNISPATPFFSQPHNLNLPTVNPQIFPGNTFQKHISMKRRRGKEEGDGPAAKRKLYEERMAHRLDSLDLSNENPSPAVDLNGDEFGIYEMDAETLDDVPQSLGDDFDEPIIEEPEDDDKIILSNELKNFMKKVNDDNLLSKFHKKSGHELVLWRPPPIISPPSSSDNSNSSMNDRITEVPDDEDGVIDDMIDGFHQSHVTFPEETSSTRSSASSPSSSTSSSDGNYPTRMPTPPQNIREYEPMEMD